MGDERGKAEGKVLEPALEEDVLGLVGDEDDRCGRVGGSWKVGVGASSVQIGYCMMGFVE